MDNLTILANRLVALGIAEGPNNYNSYSLNEDIRNWMSVHAFVASPKVMVVAMKAVRNISCEAWCSLMRSLMDEYHAKDIKLAITATCVEILEELE